MVYGQPRICPGEWDAQTPLGFWDSNGAPNPARRPDLAIINNKKTCRIVNSDIPVDRRVKLKESEKKDKYLDLVREFKKKTVDHESDGVVTN